MTYAPLRKAIGLVIAFAALLLMTLAMPAPAEAQSCSLPGGVACPSNCASCYQNSVSCTFVANCGDPCPIGTVTIATQSCGFLGFSTQRTCRRDGFVSSGQCSNCSFNYYGPFCQPCPTFNNLVCNGQGSCNQGISGNGACSCSFGFTGPVCQYGNWTTCNGNGVAQYNGSCACNPGWTGSNCTIRTSCPAGGFLNSG
jgi:hypothetical protein